jgi:hypothetical protein
MYGTIELVFARACKMKLLAAMLLYKDVTRKYSMFMHYLSYRRTVVPNPEKLAKTSKMKVRFGEF